MPTSGAELCKVDKAIADYTEVDPGRSRVRFHVPLLRGMLLYNKKEYDKAIADFSEVGGKGC